MQYVDNEDIGWFAKFDIPEFKKLNEWYNIRYFKHAAPGEFGKNFVVPTKNFAV